MSQMRSTISKFLSAKSFFKRNSSQLPSYMKRAIVGYFGDFDVGELIGNILVPLNLGVFVVNPPTLCIFAMYFILLEAV